jgi:16S rRNA (guanine527-N7)-methyltransferase
LKKQGNVLGGASDKGKPGTDVAVASGSDILSVADIAKRLKTWLPDLQGDTCERLAIYHAELLKFNRTVNLISANTVKVADSVHVADSIFASRIAEKSAVDGQPVYDFGSGNGCPGLIYAILYPARKIILVDRDQRKMEFCKHVGSTLRLANLSVLTKGVEEIPSGTVVNAISRGFAPFSKSLILCRKSFRKGGRFFHLKGDGWANELASMPSQVFSHWSPSLVGQYRLPEVKTEMFVVMTEKTAE